MNRRFAFLLGFGLFAGIGAVAGNVGPMLIQNYGSDIDNPAAFRSNIGLPASATTDTTNAFNITSGTLPAARLGPPAVGQRGGVYPSDNATLIGSGLIHYFVKSIDLFGNANVAQPAAADISGLAASATTDTTNATNITTGTLPVARLPAGTPPVIERDIIPMVHAQRLRTEQTPAICMAGDSLGLMYGTGNGANDNVTMQQTYFGLLAAKLQRDNPSKTFNFQSYAIGGTTLGQLGGNASVPLASQSWSGTPAWSGSGTSWLTQLASFNCSQLYIVDGENDSVFTDPSALKNILVAMAGKSNPPDVFLIPSEFPGPSFIGVNPVTWWEFPASLFRNTAWAGGQGMITPGSLSVGLLDIGGWQAQNVYGADYRTQALTDVVPRSTPLSVTFTSTTAPAYGYTSTATTAGEFYVDVTFPGQASTIFNGTTNILAFTIGSGVSNINLQVAGGRIYFSAYPFYGSSNIGTSISAPASGDLNVILAGTNSRIYMIVNGALIYNTDMPRAYTPGLMPALQVTASNPGYAPTMTINQLSAGKLMPVIPTMTATQYFGDAGSGCTGGGADGHPSTCGYSLVKKYVDGQDLSAAPAAPPPVPATLAANFTVALAGPTILPHNPNGGAWIETLPTVTTSNNGLVFTAMNTGSTGTLQFKSGASNVGSTIAAGAQLSVVVVAGAWVVQ